MSHKHRRTRRGGGGGAGARNIFFGTVNKKGARVPPPPPPPPRWSEFFRSGAPQLYHRKSWFHKFHLMCNSRNNGSKIGKSTVERQRTYIYVKGRKLFKSAHFQIRLCYIFSVGTTMIHLLLYTCRLTYILYRTIKWHKLYLLFCSIVILFFQGCIRSSLKSAKYLCRMHNKIFKSSYCV